MPWEFNVYILECSDGSYYTGVSANAEERFHQHQEGTDPLCYTYKRRPVKLVHFEEYQYIGDAIMREKQLKGWSHEKKKALIQEDLDRLVELSKGKRHKKDDDSDHPSTSSG